MARLFISLYVGLLSTLFVFVFVAHLINTFWVIDIENVIAAKNFSAEITLLEEVDKHISQKKRQSFIDMIALNNQVIIKEVNSSEVPIHIQQALQTEKAWFDDEEFDYFKAFAEGKYYQIEENEQHELLIIDEQVSDMILLTLVVSVALCCFIWLFGLHRKLKLIEKTLMRISEGDLSARAPTSKSLQVGQLNKSLNTMADKMVHLLESHKRLTHTIAHELRTPLFRMQIHLELLEQTQQSQQTGQSEHTQGLEEEIFCLEDMVDELLSYARMERAELTPSFEQIELSFFLKNLCDKLTQECTSTITFTDHVDTVIPLSLDITLIARAITNLIRNAEKYGDTHIYVSVTTKQNMTYIHIEDDGKGIGNEHQKHIFDPYYRINDSEKMGFGLGLAIVKEIALLHRGDVNVTNSQYNGAKFTMALPTKVHAILKG